MATGRARLYGIWSSMKYRCYNPKHTRYNRYGGRGITVCDEWMHNFQAFHDWSMSHGYADDLTIDRIDNDGNYEPGNCRWITLKEQQNNKSTCIYISYGGKTKTIHEWADELGIYYQTLYFRIINGWPIEKAFFEPVDESTRNRYQNIKCLPNENRALKVKEYKRRISGIRTKEERLTEEHKKVMDKVDAIKKELESNPDLSFRKIALNTGIPKTTIQRLKKLYIDKI